MAIWNKTSFVNDVIEAVEEDFAAKRRKRFRNSAQVLCFMLADQNIKSARGLLPENITEAKTCLRLHYDRMKVASNNDTHNLEHQIIDYLDEVQEYLRTLR